MWNGNSAMETVNAAASAIAFAEARATPISSQKKRWTGCLSAYWCFGSRKQNKRIGRSVLVPEPASTANDSPSRDFSLPPSFSAPFAAPPSSPVSFAPSEPPSASQSPTALVPFNSFISNIYSPDGPRSIFKTGPYAYETQVVSPPAFSTYTTTEPSTAPYTPPESVHMTTPSSPEVPFAHILSPGSNISPGHSLLPAQFDFQSYQYYPGSPVGQPISPGSVISGSGTSSPLPDQELFAGGHYYTDARFRVPPSLLNFKLLQPICGWGLGHHSCPLNPDRYLLDLANNTVSFLPSMRIDDEDEDDDFEVSQRVSFELALDDVARCVEKGRTASSQALQAAASEDRDEEEHTLVGDDKSTGMIVETYQEDETEKLPVPADGDQRSVSSESTKEFNFDSVNNKESDKPSLGPIWWTTETVNGKEEEYPRDHWNFVHAL